MDVPRKVLKKVGKVAESAVDAAGTAMDSVIDAGRKVIPGMGEGSPSGSRAATRRTTSGRSATSRAKGAASTKGAKKASSTQKPSSTKKAPSAKRASTAKGRTTSS